MAYAEKRGKGPAPWRVKYRLPSGQETSESGFETKAAALAWGRDQEARIREGRWTDPDAGKVTVSEWIDRWLATQDVGVSTEYNRDYLIRRFIRPAWGDTELSALSTEEITKWEHAIPAKTGVSVRTARAARTLLGTILGDAAATRPPLIQYNPALRARNRGRRTGRHLERDPQRAWATPLQVLLLAERATLLSGRDDDFTLIITIGYTGLRWGEAIGLERDYVHTDEVHVEWQLHEINGRFHRLPPKDDSYRSPRWEPKLPVDLPPFLDLLLARHLQADPGRRCPCVTQHGGSGRYVFLSPADGHYRRSNYGRRVFRPACDGRYEPGTGRPSRLIIADATTWPGTPLAAWPAAPSGTTAAFGPPSGRGIQAIPEDTPFTCWLPIQPGLTPHGLRHSHKTWMAEDGIPEILAEQRLGHQVPGMRGLYAHTSSRMRDDLMAALQARWEESLRARAAISARSPVLLLDELLAPFRARTNQARPAPQATRQQAPAREDREKMISQIPPKHSEGPTPAIRVEPVLRASELAKYQESGSGARGTRTPDPVLAKHVLFQLSYSPARRAPRVPAARGRPGAARPAAAPVAPGPARRGHAPPRLPRPRPALARPAPSPRAQSHQARAPPRPAPPARRRRAGQESRRSR
jgi:integrase